MRKPYGFALADPDFYAPLETATAVGRRFRPARVADGWRESASGVWTMWRPEGATLAEDGWKVHVSARPDRLDEVLDTAAAVCFEQDVPFKHLAAQLFHQWMHGKHAARPQSGKFIAAYPPDVAAARKLMERLSEELAGEEGPYILTDRRFGDSRTVHYRYGAFRRRERMQADGTGLSLVRDGHGDLVEDRRGASFRLPPGITDPFAVPDTASSGELSFQGFAFEAALRHSNAGGAYRGRETATGRTVFIKEARAYTGLAGGTTATQRLRAEWETLKALHAADPGLAPEPIAYFREWEHEFLVTEFIDGRNLNAWTVAANPLVKTGSTAEDLAAYYADCERILDAIEQAMDRLHARGWIFVDVSPGNVLVQADHGIRLIDFEAASRADGELSPLNTPGYAPPRELIGDDPRIHDDYGVAALAQLVLFPLHQVVRRNPDALAHLHRDLSHVAAVPPPLWARTVRFHRPDDAAAAPISDDELPARLADLRDRTAEALTAMAEPDHPDRVFPTVPEGYTANSLCVAYGTAGVLHALRRAGRPVPAGVLDRLRRDALDDRPTIGPGLHVGLAGIAWVLADFGLTEEAAELIDRAQRHPLTATDATLGGGSAGVALTRLALYGRTGDERHIDAARALIAALPPDAVLTRHLGADAATGLLHGRAGIALLLQQFAEVTGEHAPLARGLRLLHEELDRATDPDAVGLAFPVSDTDRRSVPYIFSGTAGVTHAVSRYVRATGDERLSAAMPALLATLNTRFTVMSGLYQGLSGLGLVLAEHGRLCDDDTSRQAAFDVARGLFKHAVPHSTGVRFAGDQLLRYSGELWSGSAGVLLFLTQLLQPRPDPFFTVDALAAAPTP
ncbi:class III lanthionine synthetase LanKC [Streptomyces sp. NBC_01476]|uniref:class III lanthionine synthetase LanKC n=1 Tax=Streptomyces sp. NBC_01476 TaxID=2903881 RepID=UPI002E3466CD|nr:class III lanthionine synthetase LanKC [Streptomyces sp. NBC_01476]